LRRAPNNSIQLQATKASQCWDRSECGKPYEQIVAYAKEVQAHLVIMTARGGDAVDRAVFGSTAYRVIQLAPCPVLAIHT
jgi:nucleotide-binding universal stress UspA family protein